MIETLCPKQIENETNDPRRENEIDMATSIIKLI